ncbi:2-Methylisocitrate lyase, PEP mutase family [Alteromonadaceae bacterium Bs31]|nr:2-Methylisocitrate lyase, PEP mutase family [Alteromonadaceae bacterium Bs31]
MHTHKQKAEFFHSLHHQHELLVLANVWDPISALIVEQAGAQALATASAAISSSLGYRDGETLDSAQMLGAVERIASRTRLPLSVDIERGYGESLNALTTTLTHLLSLGVCGINIEDSLVEGGEMRAVNEQSQRIAHIRAIAESKHIPLFINARIDCFLQQGVDPAKALEQTLVRADAFASAGCDGIFVVGVYDLATIQKLRADITLPLNVLLHPALSNLQQLQLAGVNRVSVGPFFMRACMAATQDIAKALLQDQRAEALSNALDPRYSLRDLLKA